MTIMDRWIDRYLKRLAFGQFLGRAAEWGAGFLFVFGTAVLLVKLLVPLLWPHVLWLAFAAIPVTTAAWFLSRRNRYTREESVALLDKKLSAGGLLMTLVETPDEVWNRQLPEEQMVWQESLPKVRPIRISRYLALPLAFAIGACFVPLRNAMTEPVLRNTVGRQASQELEEMLNLLEESDVLEEEEEKELREEIEKLSEETKQNPLTHEKWETVDALRQRLQIQLDQTDMTVSKAQNALASLANAGEAGQQLSLERTTQLEQDVMDALQQLARNGAFSKGKQGSNKNMQQFAKSGEFKLPSDQAAREKMLQELKEFLDKESEKLSEARSQCPGGT